MNVSLTPELEALVNDKVRSGLYQTASEVVREALRLLKLRDDEYRRTHEQAGLVTTGPRSRRERGASATAGGRRGKRGAR